MEIFSAIVIIEDVAALYSSGHDMMK